MATLSNEQLQALARHGAQARIQELEAELAAIRAAFGIGGTRRGRKPGRKSGRPAEIRKRRGGMGAAARKAQSERMKAYWAKRRAENAATAEKPKVRAGKKR